MEKMLDLRRRGALALALLAAAAIALTAPALAGGGVVVSAHTSFDRTYVWHAEKSAHPDSVTLATGQSTVVDYAVTVTNTGYVDSNWQVVDGIAYSRETPFTVKSVTAVINPGGIAATVTCPAFTPGVTSIACTYSASLPDGSARTTTATVELMDGTTVSNTYTFDFTSKDLATGQPVEHDRCVDVADSLAGALGEVCVGDSPKTFSYPRTIGPYATCGEFVVHNTATVSRKSGTPLSSAHASVTVHVPCTGCTKTIGYWKNHAGFGPQADVVTPLLPRTLGTAGGTKSQSVTTAAKAVQFLTFAGSNDVVEASNGINKLYAQLLAAKLSIATGADPGAAASTIAAADAFLAANDSMAWASLSKSQRSAVLGWMTTLDRYNNGLIGPGHCTE